MIPPDASPEDSELAAESYKSGMEGLSTGEQLDTQPSKLEKERAHSCTWSVVVKKNTSRSESM